MFSKNYYLDKYNIVNKIKKETKLIFINKVF